MGGEKRICRIVGKEWGNGTDELGLPAGGKISYSLKLPFTVHFIQLLHKCVIGNRHSPRGSSETARFMGSEKN